MPYERKVCFAVISAHKSRLLNILSPFSDGRPSRRRYGVRYCAQGSRYVFPAIDKWPSIDIISSTFLAVIDRQFKGDIAHTMDKLTTRALQAQVEAAVRIYPSLIDMAVNLDMRLDRMWTERIATRSSKRRVLSPSRRSKHNKPKSVSLLIRLSNATDVV